MSLRSITDKRGQMGMGTAKAFLVALLSLVVIGVTTMIVFNSLGDATDTLDSNTVTNETGAYINSTGYTVEDATVDGFTNFEVTEARNASDGTTISDTEYTVDSDTGTITNSTNTTYSDVNLDYTYDADNAVANTLQESKSGMEAFFSNATTWLALLAVVIVILIISAVVLVVNRFGMQEEQEQMGGGLQL